MAVSKGSVELLRAAAEIAGGIRALSRRLGIGETLLAKFMDGTLELPDTLLLRAVDIVLAQSATSRPAGPVSKSET